MTTSSRQTTYSTISSDTTLTFDDTMSIASTDCAYQPIDYLGSGSVGIGTYTISFPSNFDCITTTTIFTDTEFSNCFPQWEKVEKMCKLYPGLEIALAKFREVYTMVKDDYDAIQNQKKNT